uniref:Uncharacterized protein n=1 Tax=Anopheles maculatus TaxID=74869 RepID=A0A182SCB9_9DIPT
MCILPNRKWSTIYIVCTVTLVYSSITPTFAARQSNRKLGKSNASYILRITKMECVDAPYKRSHLNYCHMVQFANGTVGLNTSVTIPIVLNYFEVIVKVYYKYTTYRPFMIDWSIELCQADRIGKYSPSTALVIKIIEESVPEFYYPCPHGVSIRGGYNCSKAAKHRINVFLHRTEHTPPFGCLSQATFHKHCRLVIIDWIYPSEIRHARYYTLYKCFVPCVNRVLLVK